MEKQRRDPSHQEEERIQKVPTILRLEPGIAKRNLLPNAIKLGRNPLHKEPVLQLTRKVKRIRKRHGTDNDYFSELNRIDGQLVEFEWKIFPGFTTVSILNEIQRMMGKFQCEPKSFTGRIIFMSMFNDIVWDARGNGESCVNNSKTIKEYAERFPRCHWSFPGLGSQKMWYGTYD